MQAKRGVSWRTGNAQRLDWFTHHVRHGMWPSCMLPSPEYVELLRHVVHCIISDEQPPLRTADEITAWLHGVTTRKVQAATDGGSSERMNRVVHCLIEQTHDPRLLDWTPEQLADWCRRTRLGDVRAVLEEQSAA